MKKLALVLGGGASKGYAHIGVLKVLENNNIIPDIIVGNSMGAVIGGLYASGKNYKHLENVSLKLTKHKIMDFNPFNAIFSSGLLKGKKLRAILYDELGSTTHSDTKIPFVAVATDINQGKLEIMKNGFLADNIMASCAIPGIFPIIRQGNKDLCDGGLLNNVPDDVARKLAKNHIVLSVDVIGEYGEQVEHSKIKIMELTINALTLMQTQITKYNGNNSDLRIKISQPDIAQMSFSKTDIEKSIKYGEDAMQKNLNKLKKLLQD